MERKEKRNEDFGDVFDGRRIFRFSDDHGFSFAGEWLGGDDGAGGPTRLLTDAERTVRLSHLLGTNPDLVAAMLKKAADHA